MQPPAIAFLRTEQVSIPLTEAEQEEERETWMYIEMFSRAEPEQSRTQAQTEPTQAVQIGNTEDIPDSDSERMPSNEEAGDEEAQQKIVQAIVERLKAQLPAQVKGKQKVDEVKNLSFEELEIEVITNAKQNQSTLENEVQK